MSRTTTPPAISGVSAEALSSLFQAIGGLRNRSALIVLASCLAVGVLATGLVQSLFGPAGLFSTLVSMVLLFVASATGVNAAGVLLMDQARAQPPRPLADALRFGLLCLPKVLVLAVAALAVALVLFLAMALLFVVCKIPLLGTLLFTIAFPLAVLIAGVTLSGLWLGLFLVLPAIWQGATVTRALAQALAIVRNRLVESFLMLAVVGLLCACVGAIVFGVLFVGLAPSLTLSSAILGGAAAPGMAAPMVVGGFYRIAGGTGLGLLWALAAALVSQVWLLGLNLVYLRVSEGLDAAAAEQVLSEGFDEARRRASEVSHKAREAAERAREQARHAMGSASGDKPSSTPTSAPHQPPASASPQAPEASGPSPRPAQPPVQPSAAPAQTPPSPPPVITRPPVTPPQATAAAPAPAEEDSRPVPFGPVSSPASYTPASADVVTDQAAPPLPPTSSLPAADTAAETLHCPQCAGPITRNDVFCGACGHRLKPPPARS